MLLNGNKGEMKEDSTSSEIVNSGTGMQPNGAALPSEGELSRHGPQIERSAKS